MVFSSSILSRFSSWSSVPLLWRKRLLTDIVGTPPPLLKGGAGPSKKWVTCGSTKNFARKGGKPWKWGWCRNGGFATFFITLQFNCIYCVWVCVLGELKLLYCILILQSFELTMQDSQLSLLTILIICIFFILSDSVQKMLIALLI